MKKYTPFLLAFGLSILQPAFTQCDLNPFLVRNFEFNGSGYEVVLEKRSWQNAAACAASRGGKLIEINSQQEQDAVFDEINMMFIEPDSTIAPDGGGASYLWIGGNDFSSEGNWVWNGDNDAQASPFWTGTSNGTPVNGSYENWGNEPDNWNNQDGLALAITNWPLGQAGQWNDVFITNELYFIIEYPPFLLGTSENASSAFSIHPNPASEQTAISLQTNEGQIILSDLSGKIILTKTADPGITVLDVSGLSTGTYLVQAGQEIKRLVVE
ncbi:hypothetical protein D3C87_64730 [compost metagenome]